MSLPTPSQSVSHKWFHQCVNSKKKINLRHPLPTFGSFSFLQGSLWLWVDKVLKKLTKCYKSELRHINFNVTSWFLGNVRVRLYLNTQWGGGFSAPCLYSGSDGSALLSSEWVRDWRKSSLKSEDNFFSSSFTLEPCSQ